MERFAARVDPPWDAGAWRRQARQALRACIAPADVDWLEGDATSTGLLPARDVGEAAPIRPAPRVPRAFIDLAVISQ